MNKKLTVLASGVAVIVVIALAGAWWLGLFSDPEEEVSLEASAALASQSDETDATPTTEGSTTDESADASAETTAPPETTTADTTPIGDDLTGTWQVTASEATFVGYRIQEVLSGVGDFTAVGRTAGVTGELVASGSTIDSVSIVADLTLLVSDNGSRDSQLRRQGLETQDFPEATFVLTQPIELGTVPAEGETITATGIGDLTLHGVTNSIELPIEGQIIGGSFVIVGSTSIAMADYDIEAPKAPVVASVEDVGVMEFSLVFTRA